MTRTIDRLYHAAPLHFVPAIFAAGALYAKSVLAANPSSTHPRRSAYRRDIMLGLGDYVHLSPRSASPLLADKMAKGYPHVILVFDGQAVLNLAETAVLPYNTKAWHTRAAYAPVTDPYERETLLRRYLSGYRLPSLEILVKYGLSLAHLQATGFINDDERRMTQEVLEAIDWGEVAGQGRPSYDTRVDPELFGMPSDYQPRTLAVIRRYFDDCRSARMLLPAPNIEFD